MRKVLSSLLLSLVLVATVTPLATADMLPPDAQPGGRLELVTSNTLTTLDNTQEGSSIQYNMVAGALYEGLYHFTPEGELEPGLAAGMPEISDDGLVYTFALKPGAMFAGPDFEPREVTAEDVAYGLTRGLDPNPVGAAGRSWGYGYLLPIEGAQAFTDGEAESVSGIEVIDDYTLQVTLTEPNTAFLLALTIATSWPAAKEAVDERGEGFADAPVGAGPFYVKEYNKDSDITLARNPGYVNAELPYLDEIHIDLGVDEATQVLRLESGEADGVFEQFTLSPASLSVLRQNPDITFAESVGPRTFYLSLNNQSMFADKDVRQAVAHAASKEFVAQFGGLAKPWNQLISSVTPQSDPEGTTTYEYDPDKAAELLAASSYEGTPVRIIYDVADPYTSANVTRLKQDLEAVGFTVDLQGLQQSEFFARVYDPSSYDINSTYWSADYPDAEDYIVTNFVCGSFLNLSQFCDEDIDARFYATYQMEFGEERDAELRAVQQALIDEVAGVPVMEVTPQVVMGPRVGDIPSLATYAPYDWKRAWLKADA